MTTRRGRPQATSAAAIEQAAFRLFAERGFAATTLDDIAEEVGVTRRTLFGYYRSKNDIPWGDFDATLDRFRGLLEEQPAGLPLATAVHRAVVAFNDFPADAEPPHRERMRLILTTPELQAHSTLRYRQWRRVIADHVAAHQDLAPEDLLPITVGRVSLALALSAYERWLAVDDASLSGLLEEAMELLNGYMCPAASGTAPA